MRPVTLRLASVVAVAAGLALSASAWAQQGQPGGGGGDRGAQPQRPERGRGGGGGFGGMGMFGGGGGGRGPSVSKADVERIGTILNMDKQQLEAATMLHEAYVTEYEAYAATVRTKMEDLRREAREDPSVWGEMREEMRKAATKRTELENKFLTDMKDVLTPAQTEKWPSIERMRTRERTIGMGMMSGERVDVVRQVETLKLDPAKAKELEPVLEQYSVDLDRELKARNALYESAQGQAQDILMSGDTAKMTKMIEDARAAASRVRDVNKRYARQVEALLPEEHREAFATAVRRESFPMIYREGRTARTLKSVQEFRDLTAEQKQALSTIMETHTRELSGLQAQMERAQDQRESTIKADEVVGAFMGGGGGRGGMGRGMMGLMDSPELETLRTKRRELDTTTLDKVKALLTPEQKTRLEEGQDGEGDGPGPRRGRNRDGGEGGGNGQRPGRDARPANQQS